MEMLPQLKSDIPLSLAVAAHAGTSFSPESRGAAHLAEYAATLEADRSTLAKHALEGGTLDLLDAEFERFRAGYRERYTAWLRSKSRCMSVMICGPSNFPGRRNQKRNEIEARRCSDLIEFRERAIAAAIRNLRPDLRPIMAGDANATERLADKIRQAEFQQDRMKAVNAAIRKHRKAGEDAQVRALAELGYGPAHALELLKPDFMGRVGYADFELTNNNANIRRMKERVAKVAQDQATPETAADGEHARIEDCPAENRVRLFFPGKPEAAVRDRLKRSGFRWGII